MQAYAREEIEREEDILLLLTTPKVHQPLRKGVPQLSEEAE